ncbi:hypothetical protein BN946_scf185015.g70 [Trametes cinnabarina]|uniref:Uncharacterized protein n=1 Tax=Pycnoporus cinnabarinus TaxID=5643 RepID=A0A060SGW6_PYCCI|nr:hypothetical protein BN946_scf185015.g70 [Trametes cinnabarina]
MSEKTSVDKDASIVSGAESNATVAEGTQRPPSRRVQQQREQQQQSQYQHQQQQQHAGNQLGVDMEIMACLAKTQNNCFAELGYHPTLLQDFQALHKQCEILKSDNQKLYADNRSLAQFIQAQDQRLQLLTAPVDQQRRALAELHERVRVLMAEREEIAGRLHSALNEVMLLRQELSRFIPNARVVPAHERLSPGQPIAQQRVVSMPPPQRMVADQPPMMTAYQRQSPTQQQQHSQPYHQQQQQQQQHAPPKHRSIQPLPVNRHAEGHGSPTSAAAPPLAIAHHRRTSAPTPSSTSQQNEAVPSPISISPLNDFSGLSLASPATAMASRPPTAGSSTSAPPAQVLHAFSPPESASPVRSIHVIPVPLNPSSSSLAGAIVDLTANEPDEQESARKRRKTDHTPETSMAARERPRSAQNTLPVSAIPAQVEGYVPPPRSPSESSMNGFLPAIPAQNDSAAQPLSIRGVSAPPSRPPSAPAEDIDMEQPNTLEEDCLEANFVQDEGDDTKLWCIMCRSRYQKGHISEPPPPFVGVPVRDLVAHCETVHPQGWKILKEKVATMRALDSEEPV